MLQELTDARSRHATEAVRLAAIGDWPAFVAGEDVFRIIVFIEAAAMVGDDQALECFDTFYAEALEDETWTEYREGHVAQLRTLDVIDIQQDEFGCADPSVAAHYATLTTKAPPIFIKDDVILDGNHRIAAAVTRGDVHADAYLVSKTQATN